MTDLQNLLDQIVRLDQAPTKGPWWEMRLTALARTALPQLAAAVKGVLDVLDTYPAPRKEADPTGYATARLALLEHRIREAIGDQR